MPDAPYEFVVFGSTPMAGLLAGLLATEHGKKVCVVAEPSSPFRLARGVDLSAMPVTRPETWALLRQGTPETLKLIGRIHARGSVQRIDPVFIGETPEGIDALSHMLYVATGFGVAVERVVDGALAGGAGFRVRDAVLLHRAALDPAITAWLEKSGVGRLNAREISATLRRDGSARVDFAGRTLEAAHAVLADDEAITTYLDVAERDRTLLLQHATAMLSEPTHRLAAPVMAYVDRGVTLMRGRGRGIFGLSLGRAEQALARVGGCLAGHGPLRRAGQRVFQGVATVDGAPLVGPARGLRATVVAGMGMGGAFFAPALARLLAGVASEKERAFFNSREAGRGNARTLVADYAPAVMREAQT